VQAKGARRDAWQVLANGGWATASIALGQKQAFVGALAAAAADTWATEIGMLAGRQPRSIVTLLPVPTGTSSGVTPEGLLASLIGGVVVGVSWSIFGGGRRGVLVAAVAGSCGSVVDSLIGATLQALYRCRACNQLTESRRHPACGGLAESLRGYGWINNDAVNSMATLTGAVVGGLIGSRPDAARHVRGGG
jgi:uncharacterized membrane protein